MLPVESGYTGVTFCCGRRIAKRTEETTGASHKSYFQDRWNEGRKIAFNEEERQ